MHEYRNKFTYVCLSVCLSVILQHCIVSKLHYPRRGYIKFPNLSRINLWINLSVHISVTHKCPHTLRYFDEICYSRIYWAEVGDSYFEKFVIVNILGENAVNNKSLACEMNVEKDRRKISNIYGECWWSCPSNKALYRWFFFQTTYTKDFLGIWSFYVRIIFLILWRIA